MSASEELTLRVQLEYGVPEQHFNARTKWHESNLLNIRLFDSAMQRSFCQWIRVFEGAESRRGSSRSACIRVPYTPGLLALRK